MAWTKEQQLAIDQRGKNILVAAAAGSGKTAVLVERIKKLIIEDGVAIDRMLIVTFTNAAAAEMKEKLRKTLIEEIDRAPEDSAKLREQLALLPRANISTFHAFALEVIRRFFYEAEVEPGFSICDDAQRTILKEDAMDILMESRFAAGDEAFYEFLNWYSGDRSQNKIREIIDGAYNVLQSLPYPWRWLKEKVDALSMTAEELKSSPLMDYIWSFTEESISQAETFSRKAAETLAEAGLTRMAEKVEAEELSFYETMEELCRQRKLEELGAHVKGMPTLRLTAKKDEKETYGPVKNRVAACRKKAAAKIKELESLLFAESFEEQAEELNRTAPLAETLQELLLEFDGLFRAAKAEKKLVDFNDIEHFCLEILEEPQAAEFYRKKFEYIFIDEYQDTNILQEEIISKIRQENNLFMVGDIKQSIYKFRLAEPEIFRQKYTCYSSGDPNSVKIDLNRNFRSKPVILGEINKIFANLMEDYDEKAVLYPGLDYDGAFSYQPQVRVVDAASVDAADDELAALKNTELEALEVCRIIRENLGRRFYDHKAGKERTIRPRDIVILMRGVRNYADIFYNTLKENGIESFVDESEGYFDTMEIAVFMNLLSVIDNKMQDVPLISVLHSEIFKFSAEELGAVRGAFPEGSYAEAFIRCGQEESCLDPALRQKCEKALDSIRSWKEKSGAMPLGKFIWSLLMETGYYIEIGAMPGGGQRQANLRALVDKAEGYSRDRQSSLYSFVRYIDAVKQRKVPMGQVKLVGENDDLVRIMTIHKSKGLEFPMVIVSGMGRRLNYTKPGSGAALHKDLGVAMTLSDYEGRWYKQTLLQRLMAKQVRREEVQEEIRILYVALTRAKDILYMTGTVRDGEKFLESRDTGMGGDAMYLDMAWEASSLEMVDANLLSPQQQNEKRYFGNPIDWDIYDGVQSKEEADEIRRRLDYVYPHEAARKLKSKYSVTELNRMEEGPAPAGRGGGAAGGSGEHAGPSAVLAVPKFRQEEKPLTAAEKGTVYHDIMEQIDFSRALSEGNPYLKAAAAAMVDAEILTEKEISAVNLGRIEEFFKSPLGRRCAAAFSRGKLERERPFNLQKAISGEIVTVQGIIDCFFEEDDGIVLLDYKTNWIDRSKPFEAEAQRLRQSYRRQIDIYSEALEEALGKPVKEAYLYLFGAGCGIRMD